jgi:hypothetical protein
MTDSSEIAMCTALETCSECPFEDRSVWDAYWSRPGKFHIKMFKNKPEQLQQILQYFADAKLLQKQRKYVNNSYRFPMTDLARYFGVQSNTLSKNVTGSNLFREFVSRSAQEAQQENGGSLPIPCLPAISIIGGDGAAPDVKPLADCFPEHGPDYIPEHGPVDAAAVALRHGRRSPVMLPLLRTKYLLKVELLMELLILSRTKTSCSQSDSFRH